MDRRSLLVIEDDDLLRSAYLAFIDQLNLKTFSAGSIEEGVAIYTRERPDVVLLDLLLPDGHGLEFLTRVSDAEANIIVVTGENSVESTRKMLLAGAKDYLLKPINSERLLTTVENTLERISLKKQINSITSALPDAPIPEFIGNSLQIKTIYKMVESAASCNASVFIGGESGTGKELCAEAIHRLSRRSTNPFVALNCAAIPADLMESEVFGHRKGAFSGATEARAGAAGRVKGGTLFLDEICDMDLGLQAKLLRLLQSGHYRPVGSDVDTHMDARIICASNKNPLDEVNNGRFREDLYYRLCVLPINMPPLKERVGDVRLLANHFINYYGRKLNRNPLPRFTESALATLEGYSWPGNIRQLGNIVQNLIIMNQDNEIGGNIVIALLRQLDADDSHFNSNDGKDKDRRGFPCNSLTNGFGQIRPLWMQEKEIIERAIEICQGSITEAADRLEINCSTIYRKKKQWAELNV
ncbi:sigma-54 dependent transcriptional regulator [Motiliproteus sp. MSK22-1]|uniref:sigma-54-dependent transcriptional regulator n=1 Tax=Motiliproteus sp. MSK22-1 TaxID=1897630 RepID=UPI000977BA13|nr:sigma-54 dependent transcriptional regulator [Motiliproteus sp. MSK22-1]OMH32703.1 hypothetical protein BGP75_14310 [Motiliproteus sp. MSK22-1]